MISRYGIFMTVVEKSSFTKAAEELGYSQSAISQAILAMEKELDVKLLVRAREGITLTKDGESYLPYINAIYNAEKSLVQHSEDIHGLKNQKIVIGTFTSVSRNLLPPLIGKFHEQYPNVYFELRQGEYDQIREWILEGSVDFGFLKPEYCADLEYEEVFRDSMTVVLPKDHVLAQQKSVSLKQLEGEPYILLDEGKTSLPMQQFVKAGVHPNVLYKVYDDYSIISMVRQGLGVSIMYGLVTAGFEKDVALLPLRKPIERTIAVAYKSEETLSVAAGQFVKWSREQIPELREKLGFKM